MLKCKEKQLVEERTRSILFFRPTSTCQRCIFSFAKQSIGATNLQNGTKTARILDTTRSFVTRKKTTLEIGVLGQDNIPWRFFQQPLPLRSPEICRKYAFSYAKKFASWETWRTIIGKAFTACQKNVNYEASNDRKGHGRVYVNV